MDHESDAYFLARSGQEKERRYQRHVNGRRGRGSHRGWQSGEINFAENDLRDRIANGMWEQYQSQMQN
jgi:hypothetical protein